MIHMKSMSRSLRRILTQIGAICVVAAVAVACVTPPPVAISASTASPSVAPSPTPVPTVAPGAVRSPQGFVQPPECKNFDNGTVDGSATTWKVSCPQGLLSNYLRPSLEAQGWSSCGAKVWQKTSLQIAITDAVNVSGFTGWLDQRPLGGSGCVQTTPPPG